MVAFKASKLVCSRDGRYDLDHFSDLRAGVPQLGDRGVGVLNDAHSGARDFGGFARVRGNVLNGQRHFAGARRKTLQIFSDMLSDTGNGIGLRRRLSRNRR